MWCHHYHYHCDIIIIITMTIIIIIIVIVIIIINIIIIIIAIIVIIIIIIVIIIIIITYIVRISIKCIELLPFLMTDTGGPCFSQAYSITGDPLHSRAACTQLCNVNTHSRAHCSPGARLCEQWEHGCVNNGARLCASARLCRGSPVSIPQEICTRFLRCCALLWLYIDWFSHIHQAYFTGTVAI